MGISCVIKYVCNLQSLASTVASLTRPIATKAKVNVIKRVHFMIMLLMMMMMVKIVVLILVVDLSLLDNINSLTFTRSLSDY